MRSCEIWFVLIRSFWFSISGKCSRKTQFSNETNKSARSGILNIIEFDGWESESCQDGGSWLKCTKIDMRFSRIWIVLFKTCSEHSLKRHFFRKLLTIELGANSFGCIVCDLIYSEGDKDVAEVVSVILINNTKNIKTSSTFFK